MSTATLVIRIQSRPDFAEQVKQRLLELSAPTRTHPHCLHFNLHRSLETEGLFMWYENWLNRDALAEHMLRYPLQELIGALDGMLEEDATTSLWERMR